MVAPAGLDRRQASGTGKLGNVDLTLDLLRGVHNVAGRALSILDRLEVESQFHMLVCKSQRRRREIG